MLVQLYLSYFSLAKRILLAKRIDRSVFESIITPPNVEEVTKVVGGIKPFVKSGILRYLSDIRTIPLYQEVGSDLSTPPHYSDDSEGVLRSRP